MLCFICQKHAGNVALPPGGYVYEDEWWQVAHAPLEEGGPGTLIVESKRHFLDFAEMYSLEAQTYGVLLRRLYRALYRVTGARRIYAVMLLEGVPHFHVWLIPQPAGSDRRGLDYLAGTHTTSREQALKIVRQLRRVLQDEER